MSRWTILFVLVLILLTGCTTRFSAPPDMSLMVGEPQEIIVGFSALYGEVSAPEVSSGCEGIDVHDIGTYLNSSNGKVRIRVKATEYFDSTLRDCIVISIDGKERSLGTKITTDGQAYFSREVELEKKPTFDEAYELVLPVQNNIEGGGYIFAVQFETSSGGIEGASYRGGQPGDWIDINRFPIRAEVGTFSGEVLPRGFIRYGSTGDAQRTVEVTATLWLEKAGQKHMLDTITFERLVE